MAEASFDLEKVAELARKHWPTHYALLLAEIISIALVSGILLVINPGFIEKVITYVVFGGITWILWWKTNRLPKSKRGKIGFLVSIGTGDESERKKITEDFVLTLQELLKGGPSGNLFQLVKVPEHMAEKIVDLDDAQKLRIRCRAHFMIYGRVRLRSIGSKQQHMLHLEGIVAHKTVPKEISEKISTEFAELFPRRVNIANENDVFGFEFTSSWINCVSKYIIGIAAAVSGDLNYAEELYSAVDRLLVGQEQIFPVFRKLKQRIPVRLAEINQTRALISVRRWAKTHDLAEITEMGHYLGRIPASYDEYEVCLLRSIFLFLKGRDVKGAVAALKKCKKIPDGTWLYNLGFLHAYRGDLKKAIQQYRNAMTFSIEPPVIAEIEEFLCWVLDVEPLKYQLYYCLGFLNWKIKGDKSQAIRDFETFLSLGRAEEFTIERELASKWIPEIQAEL